MTGDLRRADQACQLATENDLDGMIRMEMGFELILCDFASGAVKLLSAVRQPLIQDATITTFMSMYEWARAASMRYDGISSGRVQLDLSTMATAWFFPFNFTNPDPEMGVEVV